MPDPKFELTEVDLALDPLAPSVQAHPPELKIEGIGPHDVPHGAFIEVGRWGEPADGADAEARSRTALLRWLRGIPPPPGRRWALGHYEGDNGYGWRSRLLHERPLARSMDVTLVEVDPNPKKGCAILLALSDQAAGRFAQFAREHGDAWVAVLVRGDVDVVDKPEIARERVLVRFSPYSDAKAKCQEITDLLKPGVDRR